MKDEALHMTKFLKKYGKPSEEDTDESYKEEYRHEESPKQKKKQAKVTRKKKSLAHIPEPKSLDEKNKLEKDRTPITRERSHESLPNTTKQKSNKPPGK